MKHTKQVGFTKAKFTPRKIANKKLLDIDVVSRYFSNHTLAECAAQFGCSPTTIKRHLRAAAVDTSTHNHSPLAHSKIKRKYAISDVDLTRMFIDDNLDTKTIAELHDVHFNVVRKHVRRLGLRKSREAVARSMSARHIRKHGCRHPAQRPDVLAKIRCSTVRAHYKDRLGRQHSFRLLHELGYALLLDSLDLEWYYEEMRVPYVDMMTGKQRIYVIDFTIVRGDGVEWVEVKPNSAMIPEDKRVYASRCAEEAGVTYRGLTDDELRQARDILLGPLDGVSFVYNRPRSGTGKITYYFLSQSAAAKYGLDGWRGLTTKHIGGRLWSRTFVRLE